MGTTLPCNALTLLCIQTTFPGNALTFLCIPTHSHATRSLFFASKSLPVQHTHFFFHPNHIPMQRVHSSLHPNPFPCNTFTSFFWRCFKKKTTPTACKQPAVRLLASRLLATLQHSENKHSPTHQHLAHTHQHLFHNETTRNPA